MPTIEIMKGGIIFDSLADEWNHLSKLSPFSTPFQSYLWLKSWTDHFANANQLRTIVIREGSELVGLFPMIQSRSAWSSLRPLGVGPSDYLGPLILDNNESVIESITGVLVDLSKSHLVDLHQIPGDHPFRSKLLECSAIDQARCLILDLPDTYETYVAGLSKSLRYDVRRLEGKALKDRGAIVQWVSPDNVNEFADQFFALHKARWKSRGLPGAFFGKGELFQRSWMVDAVKSGTVIMNRLVSEGNPVGIVYAMKHGSILYFYQAGMDPSASTLSPGTILVSKMIERAIELGCTTFDLMRGDEPYKRRWKPTRERINSRILLSQDSVVGKTGMWWNNTAWRVELKVRERLEGKSLVRAKPQIQPHDVKL